MPTFLYSVAPLPNCPYLGEELPWYLDRIGQEFPELLGVRLSIVGATSHSRLVRMQVKSDERLEQAQNALATTLKGLQFAAVQSCRLD